VIRNTGFFISGKPVYDNSWNSVMIDRPGLIFKPAVSGKREQLFIYNTLIITWIGKFTGIIPYI